MKMVSHTSQHTNPINSRIADIFNKDQKRMYTIFLICEQFNHGYDWHYKNIALMRGLLQIAKEQGNVSDVIDFLRDMHNIKYITFDYEAIYAEFSA